MELKTCPIAKRMKNILTLLEKNETLDFLLAIT
jgi:hypothetical protein